MNLDGGLREASRISPEKQKIIEMESATLDAWQCTVMFSALLHRPYLLSHARRLPLLWLFSCTLLGIRSRLSAHA